MILKSHYCTSTRHFGLFIFSTACSAASPWLVQRRVHVWWLCCWSLSIRIYLSSPKECRAQNIFLLSYTGTLQLHLVLPADCCINANQLESNYTPRGQAAETCTHGVWMSAIKDHSCKHSFEHSALLLRERSMLAPDFFSIKEQFSTELGFLVQRVPDSHSPIPVNSCSLFWSPDWLWSQKCCIYKTHKILLSTFYTEEGTKRAFVTTH